MSQSEQHAAEELERIIAARQAGRTLPPNPAASVDAAFAGRLVDSTRAARMDPEFAALLETELNRQHPQTRAAATPSFRQRWDAFLGGFTLRLSQSGGLAVALTVVIALASFAVFRFTQSGPASTAASTSVPFVASVATVATPVPAQPTAIPTVPLLTPTPLPALPALPTPIAPPIVVLQPATPTSVPTRIPPSPTRTPVVPSPTPKPTAAPASISRVKIVMLDVNGGGSGKTIGCGDTLVFVDRDITPTSAPLSAAIREQLSIHDLNYGQSALYNALYQSNLTLASASIVNGHATINLTGNLSTGGVCDIPRVEAQLEETALQFSTVTGVTVYVNNVELHQALSQK